MNKLTHVSLKPLQKSKYMTPLTMHYVQNGKAKTWELLKVYDGVTVIVYNTTRNVLVLVKQFRPAVYFGNVPEQDRLGTIDVNKYPAELGITLELCGGAVDKEVPLNTLAAQEVFEECGYKVDESQLKKISSYRSGVGNGSNIQTSFYCEVTDGMKVTTGGGVQDEIIEIIEMPVPDVEKYIAGDCIRSPVSFLYNVTWFLYNKKYKFKF